MSGCVTTFGIDYHRLGREKYPASIDRALHETARIKSKISHQSLHPFCQQIVHPRPELRRGWLDKLGDPEIPYLELARVALFQKVGSSHPRHTLHFSCDSDICRPLS